MIPLAAVLRLRHEDSPGFRLWTPLFLVWLLLVPLGIVLSPLIFVVCLVCRVNPFRGVADVADTERPGRHRRRSRTSQRRIFIPHCVTD